jgi:ferritin-like metal-binding protein YciE
MGSPDLRRASSQAVRALLALPSHVPNEGGGMAELLTLDDLFLHELRDLYDAEQRLTKALLDMADAATSADLKQAFRSHLTETKMHVTRLEQIFGMFDVEAKGETCEGIKGLIEEGDDLLSEDAADAVADAGLIASAQKVEHYEIAGYGTLRTWADLLGRAEAAQLLEFTLEEEKKADHKLTEVAARLNLRAAVGT